VNPSPRTSESAAHAEHSRWFSEEVQPHEPALRAWLKGRFPSLWDVDDLIQETYARVLRARMAGKVVEARPYLFATARNTACGIYRRSKIISTESLAELDDSSVV
jgi:DNA-directed RNA polymerase specialized sigma24 family protein